MSEEWDLRRWMALVGNIPEVSGVRKEGDFIVAVVATRVDGRKVRSAVRGFGIPEEALRIRLVRHWLDPHPNDPEESARLLKQELAEWEKEDEDL